MPDGDAKTVPSDEKISVSLAGLYDTWNAEPDASFALHVSGGQVEQPRAPSPIHGGATSLAEWSKEHPALSIWLDPQTTFMAATSSTFDVDSLVRDVTAFLEFSRGFKSS